MNVVVSTKIVVTIEY